MITGQAFELLILQLTVAPVSVYARVDFATQSTSSESTTRINPEPEQPTPVSGPLTTACKLRFRRRNRIGM